MNNSIKRKTSAIIFLLLLAAAICLVNILCHHYNFRVDLTKNKQHTLSSETKEFIESINQKVDLTALYVGIPPKYLEHIFMEYERVSKGMIETKIIDPLVDLGYAAQFGNVITGDQKKVIVQSASDRQDVDFTDDVLTEELLTNAIIRVLRKPRSACFLTGHNEFKLDDEDDHGLITFNKLLLSNNVNAVEVFLETTQAIPPSCDVLILAGPQRLLNKKENDIIDSYLAQGGDALFLIEHTVVTTADKPLKEEELELNPSLNEILNNWGIKVSKDVVIDTDSHASGDVGSPATKNYLPHRSIVAGLDYTFYVRPRSISIMPQRRKGLKVAPLVLTQSTTNSWGESDRMLNIKYDEAIDRAGPVPISFVIWEPKEGEETSDTRIIVITDADFLTNAYIDAYSNARLGLNVISWLCELDYKPFMNKKVFKVEKMELTSNQKKNVIMILVVMPALIALMGLDRWLRRS